MEDIVADSGQWRMFSNQCQQMFGWPVPMYHDEMEEYYPDEPSMMAVRYLIWYAATEMDDIWWKPDLEELDILAKAAYERLSDEFEKAPVNEQLTEDIDAMLEKAENFNEMRFVLFWLFSNCYILRTYACEMLMLHQKEEMNKLKDTIPDAGMRNFYRITNSIFAHKTGPLALYPREYMAALARARSKDKIAQALDEIDVIPMRPFRYKANEDGTIMHMVCTNGREIDVPRSEFLLDDKELFSSEHCMASFIFYQGTWNLNGVMTVLRDTEDKWDELCKKDPQYVGEGVKVATPDWYLSRTGGRQLLFFKDEQNLKQYMAEIMNFAPEQLNIFEKEDTQGQPLMLFIAKNDLKDSLHFTFGFCPCVDAPTNPYYDKTIAKKEAVKMLWNDGSVSSEAVLYLLDMGYLPDVLNDELISQKGSLQVRDTDARFLLRYMRNYRY